MTIDILKQYGFRLLFTTVCCIVVVVVVWVILERRSGTEGKRVDVPVLSETDVEDNDTIDPFPNDKDRDGIEDSVEREKGLSEVLPDTDADGLFDNDELTIWKSDPLTFDTDGDGYGDGWEVLKGYSPVGEGVIVE